VVVLAKLKIFAGRKDLELCGQRSALSFVGRKDFQPCRHGSALSITLGPAVLLQRRVLRADG
jgi:hypothetical protein